MKDKLLILQRSIERDLAAIAEIYVALEEHPINAKSLDDTLIVVSYYLHNLYNAFENIFQNVAATFENSVDDQSRWHSQLLERMSLDALPLRPAVIDDAAYDCLDELRRFRHWFRHSYRVKLDAQRLQLVVRKAMELRGQYPAQLGTFMEFIETLLK